MIVNALERPRQLENALLGDVFSLNRATHWRVNQLVGAPSRIRTYDLQLRRLTLYPTELWAPEVGGGDSNPRRGRFIHRMR